MKIRFHLGNGPQLWGATTTVKYCFYQDLTLGENGLAVLLDGFSWAFCRDLEVV
jgi:hypothetical protein